MEASPLPMLAASRFLSVPPLLAPTCPRVTAPFVRAATQTLEAPEAAKPPRPSPRRSAVAEVKGAPDPIAALNRYSLAQFATGSGALLPVAETRDVTDAVSSSVLIDFN